MGLAAGERTGRRPCHGGGPAAARLPHGAAHRTGYDRPGDASGTGWWATRTQAYDEEILRLAGLSPALLPEVVDPSKAAGSVRRVPGLPLAPGIAVAPGTGDNAAAALGLGLRPGRPVLSLGTSGTVYAVSQRRPVDPSGTVSGFADARGDWLPLACTLNCTLAVDRIAALLHLDRDAVEPGGDSVMLPFLGGERTPHLPHAAGLLYGLRHDTTGGQLLQAAYDGAVYALLDALDRVLDEDAAPDEPLLLIGGGAQGTAWRETVRRLSGRPVKVPLAKELVAIGAAAQAAGLLLGEDPIAVARRWDTARGPRYAPLPPDEPALQRISTTLSDAGSLLRREEHRG